MCPGDYSATESSSTVLTRLPRTRMRVRSPVLCMAKDGSCSGIFGEITGAVTDIAAGADTDLQQGKVRRCLLGRSPRLA